MAANYHELRRLYKEKRAYNIRKQHEAGIVLAVTLFICLAMALWATLAHADTITIPHSQPQLIKSATVILTPDGYHINQYVDAIYLAEGGKRATYAYGIRSIHYKNIQEARAICHRTIRNNIRRYQEYGHRHFAEFLLFVQSRFAPTAGRDLSASEKRLNGNWVRNVRYYLEHPQKG